MAIAFDATSQSATGSATSLTWSHTCSGSDRVLVVGILTNNTTDILTGVTYNGVAMSLVDKQVMINNFWGYSYYLIAPDTGANNIVISFSSASLIAGLAQSYTGVSQSGFPDSHTIGVTTGSSINCTTTVVASNCWLWVNARTSNTPGVGAGTTEREQVYGTGITADSNGTVGTGAQTLVITNTTPGGTPVGWMILSMAPAPGIELDATSSAANQSSYPITVSHTCSGSNRILIVGVTCANSSAATISGVTYNSVAMTQIATINETTNQNRSSWLYYLIAPATGAHDVVVSFSATPTDFANVGVASYTGVMQSGQPDAFGTATSGASTVTSSSKSITTIADRCWLVGIACNSAGTTNTADAGTVFRLSLYQRTSVGYEGYFLDSNGQVGTAGSHALGYSWSGGASRQQIIVASLAPFIASDVNSGFFNFM